MKIVDGRNLPLARIIDHLRLDSTHNLFAVYDLLKEPENTSIRLAVVSDKIVGYLLKYEGLSHPNAIIRGAGPAVSHLLDEVKGEKTLLFLDSDHREEVEVKLSPTAIIPEDLMSVRSGGAMVLPGNLAKRLGPDDARSILELYSGRTQIGEDTEGYAKWIERHVVYGVFRDEVLVSVAGTWAETEEGWIIGGVYTSPSQRKKGFASMATSAVTEQALMNARQATLFVVSSNRPAIRIYEKLGYRKVGGRLWVDMGTGLKPLTSES